MRYDNYKLVIYYLHKLCRRRASSDNVSLRQQIKHNSTYQLKQGVAGKRSKNQKDYEFLIVIAMNFERAEEDQQEGVRERCCLQT